MKQAVRERLADDFLAAALEPQRWMAALEGLAEQTGSMRGQLIGIGGPSSIPFNWVNDFPERVLTDFIAIEGGSDRINYRVAADRLSDTAPIKHEAHYAEASAMLESDVYFDFCEEYDLPFGCQTTIFKRHDMLVGLALLRSRRDGPTSREDRQLFASMVPHVRAAVAMQLAIENQGAALIAGALEAMSLPAFVLDALGRVSAFTSGAEDVLASSNRIRLIDRQLRGPTVADDRAIDEAIAAALQGEGQGHAVIRAEQDGYDPALLSVMRLPARPMNFGFAPHALAILRLPDQHHAGPRLDLLRLAFGLSSAEASVAAALAAGRSRAEIALQRGVSFETVKAQVKSLFLKTGVSREAELIAKLSRFGV